MKTNITNEPYLNHLLSSKLNDINCGHSGMTLKIRDCKKCKTPIQGYNAILRKGKQSGYRCRKCYNKLQRKLQKEYRVQRILKEIQNG